MQGMMVMLMAVSGLGCHHGHSAPADWSCYDSCYSSLSGCYDDYAATAYSACYGGESCYSSCFAAGASCYTYDSCYVPEPDHGCCLFRGLKRLFSKHHRQSCYDSCYGSCYDSCYDSCYSAGYDTYETSYSGCYGMPVFGSYTPVYPGGGYGSAQGDVYAGAPTSQVITGASQGAVIGAAQPAAAPPAEVPPPVPSAVEPTPTAPEAETPTPPPAVEPAPSATDVPPVVPAPPTT